MTSLPDALRSPFNGLLTIVLGTAILMVTGLLAMTLFKARRPADESH
jgi:hypothetical protein